MGDPRKKRKLYEKPKKLWDSKRIEEEKSLREEFGLKNARELWRMQTILRKIRREARRLLSKKGKNVEGRAEQLLKRVKKFLINKQDATLDDVLALTTGDILARRLESIVLKKNLAKTAKQARQFIVHGHVSVDGRKVTAPSYLTSFSEEPHVNWFKKPIAGANAGGPNGGERAEPASHSPHPTHSAHAAQHSHAVHPAHAVPKAEKAVASPEKPAAVEPVENSVTA